MQSSIQLHLLEMSLIESCVCILIWIVAYTFLEKWWRHQIGWTLVLTKVLFFGALFLVVLSIYLSFSRYTSEVAAWIQIALIGLVGPVMIWRTILWVNISRAGKRMKHGNGTTPKG